MKLRYALDCVFLAMVNRCVFLLAACISTLHVPLALAQFPREPENVTILHSKFNDGVHISYKEVLYVN